MAQNCKNDESARPPLVHAVRFNMRTGVYLSDASLALSCRITRTLHLDVQADPRFHKSRQTDYTSTEWRLVNPAALLGSGSLIRYEPVLEALSGRSVEK